jgi:hypothetical protein
MVMVALAGLVLLGSGAQQARGANLLINGDFETCDLTGWSLTGNTGSTGINRSALPPHGGSCDMSFGAISDSVLMQSAQIMTTPGAVCTFSFWLRNSDTEHDNDFSASWDNGAPLVSLVDADPFDYKQFTFMVTGTGSDNITFRARNVEDYYDLDDVSVECAEPAPAPALSHISLAGLVALLVGIGVWGTRKRTRAAS